MSATTGPWLFTDDLRLVMALPPRPDERDVRLVAAGLGRSRRDVRRRRRAIRQTLRRLAGLGARPGRVSYADA